MDKIKELLSRPDLIYGKSSVDVDGVKFILMESRRENVISIDAISLTDNGAFRSTIDVSEHFLDAMEEPTNHIIRHHKEALKEALKNKLDE